MDPGARILPAFGPLPLEHPCRFRPIGAPMLLLVIVVFVHRGSRVAWSFVAATTAFGLVSNTFSGRPWWATVAGAAGLAPLLLPSSWRFIWRPRPAARPTDPAKAGGHEGPENAGESGWRAHPNHLSWMRYWNAEQQRWLGVARTPRKVRKLWMQQKQEEGPS